MSNPLDAATERGADFWAQYPAVSFAAIHTMLGIDVAGKKYKNLVRTPDGLYPAWQFHKGDVVPGLLETLVVLRGMDHSAAAIARFFLRQNDRMNGWEGAIPIEFLRDGGDLCDVLAAALVFDTHGAT